MKLRTLLKTQLGENCHLQPFSIFIFSAPIVRQRHLKCWEKVFFTLVVEGPDLISVHHGIKIAIWFQTSLAFGSEAIIRFER